MVILDLEDLVRMLKNRNIAEVSRATGLHYNTIRNIKIGANTDPTIDTVVRLTEYLRDNLIRVAV